MSNNSIDDFKVLSPSEKKELERKRQEQERQRLEAEERARLAAEEKARKARLAAEEKARKAKLAAQQKKEVEKIEIEIKELCEKINTIDRFCGHGIYVSSGHVPTAKEFRDQCSKDLFSNVRRLFTLKQEIPLCIELLNKLQSIDKKGFYVSSSFCGSNDDLKKYIEVLQGTQTKDKISLCIQFLCLISLIFFII